MAALAAQAPVALQDALRGLQLAPRAVASSRAALGAGDPLADAGYLVGPLESLCGTRTLLHSDGGAARWTRLTGLLPLEGDIAWRIRRAFGSHRAGFARWALASIATVVIGGTSVAGGRANVPGIWGAALFMYLLVTMLNIFGASAGVRLILTGLMIIGVIVVAGGEEQR